MPPATRLTSRRRTLRLGSIGARHLLAALSVALLWDVLPGCNHGGRSGNRPPSRQGSPPADESRPPARQTARCRADKYMRFTPLVLPKEDLRCDKDADCVVSAMIPGSCCDHGCNRRWAYTRVQHEKLRAQQRACCQGIKLNCPVWRCPRDPYKHTAKCVNHRCVLVNTPAEWTLRRRRTQAMGAR